MPTERPPLVAVVDDDAEVRLALMRLLASAALTGKSFASGMEFLRDVSEPEQLPGCVVLDLQMPGLSGFDVQQHLIEQRLSVPVVVITGRDSAEARERAMGLGAHAYLLKPVDGEALLQVIAEAIGAHAVAGRAAHPRKEA